MDVATAMQAEQPQLRPTAAEALKMLSSIDEWAPMPYEGELPHDIRHMDLTLSDTTQFRDNGFREHRPRHFSSSLPNVG